VLRGLRRGNAPELPDGAPAVLVDAAASASGVFGDDHCYEASSGARNARVSSASARPPERRRVRASAWRTRAESSPGLAWAFWRAGTMTAGAPHVAQAVALLRLGLSPGPRAGSASRSPVPGRGALRRSRPGHGAVAGR